MRAETLTAVASLAGGQALPDPPASERPTPRAGSGAPDASAPGPGPTAPDAPAPGPGPGAPDAPAPRPLPRPQQDRPAATAQPSVKKAKAAQAQAALSNFATSLQASAEKARTPSEPSVLPKVRNELGICGPCRGHRMHTDALCMLVQRIARSRHVPCCIGRPQTFVERSDSTSASAGSDVAVRSPWWPGPWPPFGMSCSLSD